MNDRRTMVVYGALSAFLAMGYGVLFTVVGDFRSAYDVSDTQVGLIIGVGFLAGFVSQILIAPVADRGKARALVVTGVLVNVVGLLLMAFGGSFALITVGRIISGLGIGAAIPAVRRIVILADPDNVGRNLGALIAADVAGFATGPAVSAVLVGPFGLAAPFATVAVATALLLAVALATTSVTETVEPARRLLAVDLLVDRRVAGAVVLGAGGFLMIGAFDALWDVVHEDLGTPTWMANLGITLFALPLVVLAPIGGRLAERVGPYALSAAGLFVASGFMTAYGYLPTGEWIFGVSLLHALTDGLTIAGAGVAITLAVPAARQAGAQGLMGAAQALVSGITAIVIGGVYDGMGRGAAYTVAAAGMVLFATGGLLLAGRPLLGDPRRTTGTPTPDPSTPDPGPDPSTPDPGPDPSIPAHA